MSLLEYATLTVPTLAKKYRRTYEDRDPLMKEMRQRQKVMLRGGTNVRIRRVIAPGAQTVEINSTNIAIPIGTEERFSVMVGDWGRLAFPIVLNHFDRDRLPTPQDKKQWVDEATKAGVAGFIIGMKVRLYTGGLYRSNPSFRAIGTFNGSSTVTGSKTGFENGALRFETPTAQAVGATTYLGATRTEDTTTYFNNWFNQYKSHDGIGVNALVRAKGLKAYADSYAQEDESGINIAMLSIENHQKLQEEALTYPGTGGVSAVHYTVDDVLKGRMLPSMVIFDGVKYFANRWMQTSTGLDTPMGGPVEPIMFFNPDALEYWVNQGMDMRMGPFRDWLETSGQDADVAICMSEVQWAMPNPVLCGALSHS